MSAASRIFNNSHYHVNTKLEFIPCICHLFSTGKSFSSIFLLVFNLKFLHMEKFVSTGSTVCDKYEAWAGPIMQQISFRAQILALLRYPLNICASPKTLTRNSYFGKRLSHRVEMISDIMTATTLNSSTNAYYLVAGQSPDVVITSLAACSPRPPAETVFLWISQLYFSDSVNCISLPLRFSSCYREFGWKLASCIRRPPVP